MWTIRRRDYDNFIDYPRRRMDLVANWIFSWKFHLRLNDRAYFSQND